MAGFIYAIPAGGMISAKKLEEVGLAGIFGTEIIKAAFYSQRGTSQGPGGGDCTLICIGDDAKQLYFKPEEQTWQQSLNGKYRVGFYENDRPDEQSLRRKKQLAGFEVELGDGGKWLIPVARIITGGSVLPQSLILGKDGAIVTEALPQYAEFSAKAEKLWEDFQVENKWKEGKTKLTVAERMTFAIEALAWNYHINIEEVNLLKLITTENLGEIMAAIIDVPTIIEVAKQMKDEKKKGNAATDGG